MIELNPEQRQAMAQGEPVRIIDPLTHDAYVLVRAEVYARLAGVPQRPAEQPDPEIPPLMLRSQQAFWQDLPELLKDRTESGEVGGVPRGGASCLRAVGCRSLSGMLPPGAET